MVALSNHKFSSNVVEKCILYTNNVTFFFIIFKKGVQKDICKYN